MKARSAWFGHGFWNILEHGLSRGMDAFAMLMILWCVPTEVFSGLAISQAYVAPSLFFFVSPETILYREFGRWSAEGPERMLARLRVFRRFAWAKGFVAVALAAIVAAVFPSPTGIEFGFFDRFSALIWAFTLPLLPQLSGPDREYLRLDLDLKTLNFLTFFQRAFYLTMLIPTAYFFPKSFPLLAGCAVITAIFTSGFARRKVEAKFRGISPSPVPEGSASRLILHSLAGFSIWSHVSGVIIGWMQTMDLFFLGWFRFPAAEVGLYSVTVKLANFSLTVPYAVSNLFNVYLGRTSLPDHSSERKALIRFSAGLLVFSVAQAAILYGFAPSILTLFSRGRWDLAAQVRMVEWLRWILPACAIFSTSLFWSGWLGIRTSFRRLIVRVYVPWMIAGLGIYSWAATHGGADALARANLSAMATLIFLLAISSFRRYD